MIPRYNLLLGLKTNTNVDPDTWASAVSSFTMSSVSVEGGGNRIHECQVYLYNASCTKVIFEPLLAVSATCFILSMSVFPSGKWNLRNENKCTSFLELSISII